MSELSADKRQQIDLSTDTWRHPKYPYLPTEPYPYYWRFPWKGNSNAT
jgi:hypothetical protein